MNQEMIPETKLVRSLKNMRFYIPAYQRGYRWTQQEVGDLLDDIYEFDTSNTTNPQSYCLQPLIIKKRDDGSYEVVDGQQRLTTIFIFLKIAQDITGYKPYKIEFESRNESEQFLSSLASSNNVINTDNPDFYFISQAGLRVRQWLDEKTEDNTPRFTVLSTMFNKITNNVFFIWYEIPASIKPVDIFSRVNMGKIPLSNAELIKALIFNQKNFREDGEREQQELSLAWNRIERDLHNDSFWSFLTNESSEYETRIDLVFDYLAEEYNNALPENQKIKLPASRTNYNRTFLIYYAAYKQSNNKYDYVKHLWSDVNRIYEQFLEWYSDPNKYHIIGYLISSGAKLKDLYQLSNGKRKSETFQSLVDLTKKTVRLHSMEDLRKLSYDDSKKELRHFFLLVNIATLVCKNERQYRFPFDLYKKEKWDIEHIHATADQTDEADDSIGNLTLLLEKINRSYQDDSFSEKRKEIIERDKRGVFIPLCTKNVFLKQYSKSVINMDAWDEGDKEDYISEMWDVLSKFWGGTAN